MNILRNIFLFDFRIKGINNFFFGLILFVLLLLLSACLIFYSYNQDWKRWISLIMFFAAIKVTFDLSLLIVNGIRKSHYKLSDLVKLANYSKDTPTKKASNLLGIILIVIISFMCSLIYFSNLFLDHDLRRNGIYTTGVEEKIYWREFKKKSKSGYYLDYSYEIDGLKIEHTTKLENKNQPESIRIKCLPYLPNKHKLELIYTANTTYAPRLKSRFE